jgi:hypothetical protein
MAADYRYAFSVAAQFRPSVWRIDNLGGTGSGSTMRGTTSGQQPLSAIQLHESWTLLLWHSLSATSLPEVALRQGTP